eukprot:5463938-Lingulodinium_polyedra.AAC.1
MHSNVSLRSNLNSSAPRRCNSKKPTCGSSMLKAIAQPSPSMNHACSKRQGHLGANGVEMRQCMLLKSDDGGDAAAAAVAAA